MRKKISNFKFQISNSQSGVTLLLAILILAAILAISFSLASILLIETKSSSDLLKTEGSLYGATGVGEQALFNLKRGACSSNSPSCYTGQFNNSVVLQSAPSIVTNSNPIFTDKVLPGTNITNTPNKYDFCNVSSGSSGCNFGKVTVNYITTNSGTTDQLSVYLCQWDPNGTVGASGTYPTLPCSTVNSYGQSQNYWLPPVSSGQCGTTQQPDGSAQLNSLTVNCATWNLNPSLQQELIFTNPNGQNNIYFSVATFASDNVTPQGLPYVGKTAIDIGTSNGDVGRKIQVVAPNNAVVSSTPSSIAFDFASNGNYAASGSDIWPHTTSGSGRILFVGVQGDTTDAMTGCTYAGRSMTLLTKVNPLGGGTNVWMYLYYLVAPTLGTNNVVCSSSKQMVGMSVSYTGAAQSGVPDALVTNTKASDAGYQNWYTSLTTVADGSWAIELAGADDIYAGQSLPSVVRADTVFANGAMLDTGGPISPPGNATINAVGEGGAAMTAIMASFAP
jgi:hypothetical protein